MPSARAGRFRLRVKLCVEYSNFQQTRKRINQHAKKGAEPTFCGSAPLRYLRLKRLDLLLVEQENVFEVSCDNLSGLLVLLLYDDEGLNSFLALTDDIAVFKPCFEGEAVMPRIIAISFFLSPAFRNLFANEARRVL